MPTPRVDKLKAQAAHYDHHAQRHEDAGRPEIAATLRAKAEAARQRAKKLPPEKVSTKGRNKPAPAPAKKPTRTPAPKKVDPPSEEE